MDRKHDSDKDEICSEKESDESIITPRFNFILKFVVRCGILSGQMDSVVDQNVLTVRYGTTRTWIVEANWNLIHILLIDKQSPLKSN